MTIVGVVLVVFMNRTIHRLNSMSVRSEQKARAAAEALAHEIKEQSLEMERSYRQVREERDTAFSRLTELGHGG